jgi:uncharacterized membrane protein YkvA (DUF1232 family)
MSTLSISPIELENNITRREPWLRRQPAKWKRDVAFVLHQIRTLSLLCRHSHVPWHARLVAACAVGYLVSPIQLIPTFIPVIGQLDDLLVLFFGMKLLRRLTPKKILDECEAQAKSPVLVQRTEKEPVVLAARHSDVPVA